jgi:AcrR family transcriptional regulator
MAKVDGRAQRDTAKATVDAAIGLFFRQGYQATTLRQIADEVGVQVGSLYNYINSKEQLLFDIMRGIMVDLCEGSEAELAGVEDPLERVHRFMRYSIIFHGERQRETFIGNTELRSLSPRWREAIVDLRDRYQDQLHAALEEAVARGQVDVPDVRMATFSGLAICSHVATWYREGGPLSLERLAEEICATYAPLAGCPLESVTS